jgi:protoheme IX farnesyltransferase
MPHFLAITLFRQADFARAGILCVPVVRGSLVTRLQAVAWSMLLVPISLLPTVIGLTGLLYGGVARVLGLGFFGLACTGLGLDVTAKGAEVRWARRLFFASILYLPLLIAAMVADVLLL